MLRRLHCAVLLLAALVSCKSPRREQRRVEPPVRVVEPPPAPSARELAAASASASASGAAPAIAAPPPLPPRPPGDACRLTRGPIQLAFTGQATLSIDAGGPPDREPRILVNRDGVPRVVTLPAPRPTKPGEPRRPERLTLSEPSERASSPGCVVAGSAVFCMDKAGAIHRGSITGQDGVVVAHARPGSQMAAAMIGAQVVYAFLGDRRTREGAMTLAFAALDDGAPMTISEDGSGATFVTLATRGHEVTAMYIDARRVLTPVHARVLTGGAKLGLGPDAVIFVGGGTDGRMGGVLAQGGARGELALLPIEKDDKEFGMAAIRVEERPRDDATVTWSIYPGPIERAPLAATQGSWPIRVLRVRPTGADPSGKKALELGELDVGGVFSAGCVIAEGAGFGDPAIAVDGAGGVWLAYTDAAGTWVERRGGAL